MKFLLVIERAFDLEACTVIMEDGTNNEDDLRKRGTQKKSR